MNGAFSREELYEDWLADGSDLSWEEYQEWACSNCTNLKQQIKNCISKGHWHE